MSVVLDTSALLAWVRDESGAETVDPMLATGAVCTVNWSEFGQKLFQHGEDAHRTMGRLRILGLQVEGFTAADALRAAELWVRTRAKGLSLGDRACLAVAQRLDLEVATADRAWTAVDAGVTVHLVR